MKNNRIEKLIKRATHMAEQQVIDQTDLAIVENSLSIIFSDEFKQIASKYRYDYLDTFEWHDFPKEVIDSTNFCRLNISLPHDYLILADEGDAGLILMNTQDCPNKLAPIIWSSSEDIYNLCNTGEFKYNPTIWPSFTDFFEYLVNEEERIQKEDVA